MALYLLVRQNAVGKRLLKTGSFTEWTPEVTLTKKDMVLVWGRDRFRYPLELNGAKLLNPVLCCDKREQGERFLEAGIPIPKMYFTQAEWEKDKKLPLVKKPHIGYGGQGVVLCTDTAGRRPTWDSRNVYQKFIDKVREFRVVQVGPRTAFYMEKFKPEGSIDICWNLAKGAKWERIGEAGGATLRIQLTKLAKQVLEAVGYDFGAVDVVMDEKKKLWVLECNSRPALGKNNVVRFGRAVQRFYEEL